MGGWVRSPPPGAQGAEKLLGNALGGLLFFSRPGGLKKKPGQGHGERIHNNHDENFHEWGWVAVQSDWVGGGGSCAVGVQGFCIK